MMPLTLNFNFLVFIGNYVSHVVFWTDKIGIFACKGINFDKLNANTEGSFDVGFLMLAVEKCLKIRQNTKNTEGS